MSDITMSRVVVAGFIFALTLISASAHGADVASPDPIAELKQQLGVRDQVIRNLIRRIEQLEQAVSTLQQSGTVASAPAASNATNDEGPSDADATVAATKNNDPGAMAAELDMNRLRTAFERTLIDRGGLVLPTGTLEIDTGLTYSHSSAEALTVDGFTVYPVLIVGDIVSERVQRDTMTASLTTRLGLPWDMQAEVRVPYIREQSSRTSASGEETKLSGDGLGDIEFALSRQLWSSSDGGLDVLGSLRWKMDTGRDAFGLSDQQIPFGTGFDALSASVTGVSVLDPVVFFGGLSYTKSFAEKKNDFRVAPGDSIGLQFGTALTLNVDTSINFAFGQQFTRRTKLNGHEIPGSYSNTGTFSVGLSRVLTSGNSIDGSLVIGLSEDSPDLQLAFSMPFRSGR
jgi:hypothetical protein